MLKAENVVENNGSDTDIQSTVRRMSEPMLENVDSTKFRLKKRREKLRRLFTRQSTIDDIFENYSDRLKDVEKRQEQQRPVSAVFEIVHKQRANSDSIVADISDLTVGYKDLERKVNEYADMEQPEEETKRVIENFEKIKHRYESVKEEGTAKAKKTNDVENLSRIHSDKVAEFITWLETAEQKLKDSEKKGKEYKDDNKAFKKTIESLKVSYDN